jgi:hypothetical protein
VFFTRFSSLEPEYPVSLPGYREHRGSTEHHPIEEREMFNLFGFREGPLTVQFQTFISG